MSSDTEIYIKTEMEEDIQEMDIENFIKVEVDEDVSFDEDLELKLELELENQDSAFDDGHRPEGGLSEKEQKHVEWLQMKTQTLDSMKGKYNSQLAEYLRLAELRKISQKESPTNSGLIEETERVNEKIMKYSVEEKTIVPSIKMLQKKRAERAESMKKTIINDKMKTLEMESMISDNFPNHSQPIGHTMAASSKHAAVRQTKNKTPVNPKRLAKKKRKVELERERRKGLTQLFDELDHWVDMGDK